MPDNSIKTNNSRILMSDVLKDVMPDDLKPTDELGMMAQNYVVTVLGQVIDGEEKPLIGTLEGVMFQDEVVELEFKTMLDDAFVMLKAAPGAKNPSNIWFKFIELHNNESVTRFEASNGYELSGTRLLSIDYRRRMCVLLLNMRRRQ